MEDLSEAYLKEHCPHCDPDSQAFADLLENTGNFRIVADHHPLTEGHILIIPKAHISCVGEYPEELFQEFIPIYRRVSDFVKKAYGSVSTFEHGQIGQTVFHSHVHALPFTGAPDDIVSEGTAQLSTIKNISELKSIFQRARQYLFFSLDNTQWVVNTTLGAPRFFRDRFAAALGRPERGNWKTMHVDEQLMQEAAKENARCQEAWAAYKVVT